MQARIARQGEIVIVHLSGRVDVETAEPFREACLKHLVRERVVFDFRHLSFVGSSGILPFLETMQDFAKGSSYGFKFSGVGSEFRKVFAATPLSVVEIFENEVLAVQAFLNPAPFPVAATQAPIHQQPAAVGNQTGFGLLAFQTDAESGDTAHDDPEDRV